MNDDSWLGFSFALIDGDLIFDLDPDDGLQLRLVSGKCNLLQALELRILTPYGSDLFNVNYGLDVRSAFTQATGLHLVKELIKLNLVRTLGADPRIREIREVLFEDDPRYLIKHPGVSKRTIQDQHHRRAWNIDIELETSDGSIQSLSTHIGV